MVFASHGIETNPKRRAAEEFVSNRVGLELHDYHEDLQRIIDEELIDRKGDFLLTPIASPKTTTHHEQQDGHLIPDLVLPTNVWNTRIAININHPPMDTYDAEGAKHFDTFFRHALYLPTRLVVVDCPDSTLALVSIAATVNERLKTTIGGPFVVFRIRLGENFKFANSHHQTMSHNSLVGCQNKDNQSSAAYYNSSQQSSSPETTRESDDQLSSSESGVAVEIVSPSNQESQTLSTVRQWRSWDTLRNLLNPDWRIGVCLEVGEELDGDYDELARWAGEPVRLIVLNCDHFITTPNCSGSTRLSGRIKEFLREIILANSFMTSFVLRARQTLNFCDHILHLKALTYSFDIQHPDPYRAWNDIVQSPLQPLSMNLDSSTYQVFEIDETKYTKYKEAMIEALDHLILTKGSENRRFIIMVLGAGRGPLVDNMILAIGALKAKKHQFKIYAVDKNPSSVIALKYKHRSGWSTAKPNIEVEVVEADMRLWDPGCKADIVATELLGSFSDNELSPECIDGTWRFSTPETISIPTSYSSYLAPICSQRMYEEVHSRKLYGPHVFDQIYVVRLSNHYGIDDPQELFTFEHRDLSRKPIEGSNQRFKTLSFRSRVDTVCHGFAGYFSANLFGYTSISTVPSDKTPFMESWFPAFIPIEKPIRLAQDEVIEIFFSRKESTNKVWYEWVVLHPERSRIHSPDGVATAMSKLTE